MNQSVNTKSLADLEAEAAAALDALAAAKEAERAALAAAAEAERAAEARAAKEALRNAPEPASFVQTRGHLNKVAEALRVKVDPALTVVTVTAPAKTVTEHEEGPRVHWAPPILTIDHRGRHVYAHISFAAEQDRSHSWKTKPTGKLRMSVGDYGNKQSFPERKDGTFSYAAAALKLYARVAEAERDYQAARQKEGNAGAMKALHEEFGVSTGTVDVEKYIRGYGTRGGSSIAAPEGMVFLTLNLTVTPDQARAVLAAAKAAGVLK